MRIFRSQLKPGDEVEATLAKGGYFRHRPHTIYGVMQSTDTLTYFSEVTGEVTEMGIRNLELAGYRIRVVQHGVTHSPRARSVVRRHAVGRHDQVATLRLERWLRPRGCGEDADRVAWEEPCRSSPRCVVRRLCLGMRTSAACLAVADGV